MKVRDLIKRSQTEFCERSSIITPMISVLFFSYNRGASGLLDSAINCILAQNFTNIEVIIVDDASTDNSLEVLRKFARKDGRIKLITHPENIGLPAICAFEAFALSTGRFIAFGFDDFLFEPNAMQDLLTGALALPGSVVHGFGDLVRDSVSAAVLGSEDIPHSLLRYGNFLLNATVLVPRAILDQVGLFDPHVIMSRLCDWDLWMRIERRFPIKRLPVFVGRELGPTLPQSLGLTYPHNEEAVRQYAGRYRDNALRPDVFADFDVRAPYFNAPVVQLHQLRMQRFLSARNWAAALPMGASVNIEAIPRVITIGIYSCSSLIMDTFVLGLRRQYGAQILFIDPDHPVVVPRIVACCDVVLIIAAESASEHRLMTICATVGVAAFRMTVTPCSSDYTKRLKSSADSGPPAPSWAAMALAMVEPASSTDQSGQTVFPVFDQFLSDKLAATENVVPPSGFGIAVVQDTENGFQEHGFCFERMFPNSMASSISTIAYPSKVDGDLFSILNGIRARQFAFIIVCDDHGDLRSHHVDLHLLWSSYVGAIALVASNGKYLLADENIVSPVGGVSWQRCLETPSARKLAALKQLQICRKRFGCAHAIARLLLICKVAQPFSLADYVNRMQEISLYAAF